MKSCGVIVEYNPFHYGHQYHLQQARKETQADVMIAVMSGNFLQRGEPAIVDKWTRAEMALQHGADLVVELPFQWAVQSADYFAKGAVELLQALQCDNLCFGTEIADLDYQKYGTILAEKQFNLVEKLKNEPQSHQSFPKEMAQLFKQILPELFIDEQILPNQMLGFSYAKANAQLTKPLKLVPIKRLSAQYHDQEIDKMSSFASATAIRQALLKLELDKKMLAKVMPADSLDRLLTKPLINWENFWLLLHYQLTVSTPESLRNIYQMHEGLEYRLLEKYKEAVSFEDFMTKLKTKRYTWTRLQRLLVYVLLQITSEEIEQVQANPYIHLLGMNQTGRNYLHEQKESILFPVVTNVKKAQKELLSLDIRAGNVYQLAAQGQIKSQDFQQKPIFDF